MLYTLNEDNFLSFLVGQSICLVLKFLNETKYYYDMPFEYYVKETCNLVNSAIPNLGDEEDDIPSSLIAFYTLAILVYEWYVENGDTRTLANLQVLQSKLNHPRQ